MNVGDNREELISWLKAEKGFVGPAYGKPEINKRLADVSRVLDAAQTKDPELREALSNFGTRMSRHGDFYAAQIQQINILFQQINMLSRRALAPHPVGKQPSAPPPLSEEVATAPPPRERMKNMHAFIERMANKSDIFQSFSGKEMLEFLRYFDRDFLRKQSQADLKECQEKLNALYDKMLEKSWLGPIAGLFYVAPQIVGDGINLIQEALDSRGISGLSADEIHALDVSTLNDRQLFDIGLDNLSPQQLEQFDITPLDSATLRKLFARARNETIDAINIGANIAKIDQASLHFLTPKQLASIDCHDVIKQGLLHLFTREQFLQMKNGAAYQLSEREELFLKFPKILRGDEEVAAIDLSLLEDKDLVYLLENKPDLIKQLSPEIAAHHLNALTDDSLQQLSDDQIRAMDLNSLNERQADLILAGNPAAIRLFSPEAVVKNIHKVPVSAIKALPDERIHQLDVRKFGCRKLSAIGWNRFSDAQLQSLQISATREMYDYEFEMKDLREAGLGRFTSDQIQGRLWNNWGRWVFEPQDISALSDVQIAGLNLEHLNKYDRERLGTLLEKLGSRITSTQLGGLDIRNLKPEVLEKIGLHRFPADKIQELLQMETYGGRLTFPVSYLDGLSDQQIRELDISAINGDALGAIISRVPPDQLMQALPKLNRIKLDRIPEQAISNLDVRQLSEEALIALWPKLDAKIIHTLDLATMRPEVLVRVGLGSFSEPQLAALDLSRFEKPALQALLASLSQSPRKFGFLNAQWIGTHLADIDPKFYPLFSVGQCAFVDANYVKEHHLLFYFREEQYLAMRNAPSKGEISREEAIQLLLPQMIGNPKDFKAEWERIDLGDPLFTPELLRRIIGWNPTFLKHLTVQTVTANLAKIPNDSLKYINDEAVEALNLAQLDVDQLIGLGLHRIVSYGVWDIFSAESRVKKANRILSINFDQMDPQKRSTLLNDWGFINNTAFQMWLGANKPGLDGVFFDYWMGARRPSTEKTAAVSFAAKSKTFAGMTPAQILGLPEGEKDQEKISKAGKKAALKWHPDKNPDKNTDAEFVDVRTAYSILSSPAQQRSASGQ